MKKFSLQLDTDSINLENEIHSNSFPLKVKNLAEHCVNFILQTHNSNDCNNIKYNREIHDQEIFPNNKINNDDDDEDEINQQKIIAQIFQFKEQSFKNSTRKFLF